MPNKVYQSEANQSALPVHAEIRADVMFISGALRAARYSSPEIRQKIMNDLQSLTSTEAREYAFLFASDNNNNDHSAFDFPDSERRREIIRNNCLDAAE